MIPTPVILLGPPGGDIARVAGGLGRQAGMLALPELRIFGADTVGQTLALHARAEDRAGDGLLRAIAYLRFGAQTEDAVDAAEAWLQRRAEWPVTDLVDWLLNHSGGRHLLFHEPHAALRIDDIERILKALPDALLVQLVEPVASFCARVHRDMHGRLFNPPEALHHVGTYPTLAPSLMWFRVHDTLLRLRRDHDALRWRSLRADLARERPERVLDPLLAELGGRFDPGAATALPFAGPGPRNAPLGDDSGYLNDPDAWPILPPPPRDPGLDHPDLAALAHRIGAPMPTGLPQ